MENQITLSGNIKLPRYNEIPNVGLYLEQTVKYINDAIHETNMSITPSMVSNYVKQGYISRPVKKQYFADQIAYLIVAVLTKPILSMDNIKAMFRLQEEITTTEKAYNYFCDRFESNLSATFAENNMRTLKNSPELFAMNTLESTLTSLSHMLYLEQSFHRLSAAIKLYDKKYGDKDNKENTDNK